MKNVKKALVILALPLLLTGCIKSRTTMTINKDKSMVYEGEYLISDQLGADMQESAFQTEELKNRGIEVTKKQENGYSGIAIKKKYENIDKISSETEKKVVISDYLEENFDDSVLFKVEKGFLKNKYTATYVYEPEDSSDEDLSLNKGNDTILNNGETENNTQNTTAVEDDEEFEVIEGEITEDDELTTDDFYEEETTEDDEDMSALMGLMAEMEYTFKIVLPAESLSNNATSVSEDKKTLTWNMATDKVTDINFSFELMNMTNVYIIIGGSAAAIILVVVIIIMASKKKKNAEQVVQANTPIHTDFDPSIAGFANDLGATLPNNQGTIIPEQPMQGVVDENVEKAMAEMPVNNVPEVAEETPKFVTEPTEPIVESEPVVVETEPVVASESAPSPVFINEPAEEPVVVKEPTPAEVKIDEPNATAVTENDGKQM